LGSHGVQPCRRKKVATLGRVEELVGPVASQGTSTINILPGICPLGQHAFPYSFPTLATCERTRALGESHANETCAFGVSHAYVGFRCVCEGADMEASGASRRNGHFSCCRSK